MLKSILRISIFISLTLVLASCGGSDSPPDKAAGNKWGEMEWGKGKWGQ